MHRRAPPQASLTDSLIWRSGKWGRWRQVVKWPCHPRDFPLLPVVDDLLLPQSHIMRPSLLRQPVSQWQSTGEGLKIRFLFLPVGFWQFRFLRPYKASQSESNHSHLILNKRKVKGKINKTDRWNEYKYVLIDVLCAAASIVDSFVWLGSPPVCIPFSSWAIETSLEWDLSARAHPPHPACPGKRPRDPGLQGPRTETKTQWVGKIRAHSPTRWSYNNRTHIYIYGYGSSHSLSSSSPRERSKLNLYKESRCCCWLLFLGQTAGRQSEPLQP